MKINHPIKSVSPFVIICSVSIFSIWVTVSLGCQGWGILVAVPLALISIVFDYIERFFDRNFSQSRKHFPHGKDKDEMLLAKIEEMRSRNPSGAHYDIIVELSKRYRVRKRRIRRLMKNLL